MSKKTLQTILTTLFVIKFWEKKLKIYQLIFFIPLKKISDFQTDFFFQNQHIFTQKELYFVENCSLYGIGYPPGIGNRVRAGSG